MIGTDLRYGIGASFTLPMQLTGTDDLASNEWVPVVGEVKVIMDGVSKTIDTLPVAIAGANSFRFTLSDAEMEAEDISILVVANDPKPVKDTQFNLTTEAFTRITAVVTGLPTVTSISTDLVASSGTHDDSILKFLSAGPLKAAQARILSFDSTNGTFNFEAGKLPNAPLVGDIVMVINK